MLNRLILYVDNKRDEIEKKYSMAIIDRYI